MLIPIVSRHQMQNRITNQDEIFMNHAFFFLECRQSRDGAIDNTSSGKNTIVVPNISSSQIFQGNVKAQL